ncbi:MAG: hypothetical protein ACD_79C00769G0002 [uncultured bacterium]|nr:MAG: hypothetical protein ACD_79C00769G0002 [uncultured bacterium]
MMRKTFNLFFVISFLMVPIHDILPKGYCLAPTSLAQEKNIFQNFLYQNPKLETYLKIRNLTLDINIEQGLKIILLEEYTNVTPKIKQQMNEFDNFVAISKKDLNRRSDAADFRINDFLQKYREKNAPIFFYIVQDKEGKYAILRTNPEIKEWFQLINGKNIDKLIRNEIKSIQSQFYILNTIFKNIFSFISSSGIMIAITWFGILYTLPPAYFLLNLFINFIYAFIYLFLTPLGIYENYIAYRALFFAIISSACFMEESSFILGVGLQLYSLYQYYHPTKNELTSKGKIYKIYMNIYLTIFKHKFNAGDNNKPNNSNILKDIKLSIKYHLKRFKKIHITKLLKKIRIFSDSANVQSLAIFNKSA